MLEFSKDIVFELIFLLQLVMQNFLRQRLIIMSAKLVAKNSSILLLIAYCLIIEIFTMRCELDLKMINWFNCWVIQWLFSSWSAFTESTCCWNVVDTMYSDWLFVSLINVDFLSPSRSEIVLHSSRKRFILHGNFGKLRRLFQLLWRSWSVVIVTNNRELETTDACRWRRQWDQMIEVTYVGLSLYEDK